MLISERASVLVDITENILALDDMLESILTNSGGEVYVVSASEITSSKVGDVRDILSTIKKDNLIVFITRGAEQEKRIEPIITMGKPNIRKVPYVTKETFTFTLRNIISEHTMNLAMEEEDSIVGELVQVPFESVVLPFQYKPGQIVGDTSYYDNNEIGDKQEEQRKQPQQVKQQTVNQQEQLIQQKQTQSQPIQQKQTQSQPIQQKQPQPIEEVKSRVVNSVKEELDLEKFRESLDLNKILRELETESSEYKNLKQMLYIIEERMNNILVDTSIKRYERLDKLVEILRDKQSYRGALENIETKRFINLLSSIEEAARNKVEHVVYITQNKYASKDIEALYYKTSDEVYKLQKERAMELVELNEIRQSLNKTIIAQDITKTSLFEKFSKEGLTKSEAVNSVLRPDVGHMLAENIEENVKLILQVATETELSLSALSGKLTKMIESLFSLSKLNESIVQKEDFLNKLLVANRIEEAITIDSPLKAALRVMVGKKGSGRTATAHIAAKLQSRSMNSCIIDLTDDSNLPKYTATHKLSEIIGESSLPIAEYLAIVKDSKVIKLQDIHEFTKKLAQRYRYILLLIDSGNKEIYDFFARDALSVNFIVDDSTTTIEALTPFTKTASFNNTAVCLVDMYTELKPTELAEIYDIDPTQIKIINIPRLQSIRRATLKNQDPTLESDVRAAMEGLFI